MDRTTEPLTDPVEAVVVAAGDSRRMGGRDKLGVDLEGRSVLRWSVEVLEAAGVCRMVIVTSAARLSAVAGAPWLPDSVVAVVPGGERRQESVAAGVAVLSGSAPAEADPRAGTAVGAGAAARSAKAAASRPIRTTDPVILVHDAARPLVSPDLVRAVAEAAARHGAAIPVLPVTETLKRLDGGWIGATLDRTDVVAAQTPQGLRLSLLERAYAKYPPDGQAISGEASNLKLTVPLDIERARALLHAGLVSGRPASGAPAAISPGGRIGLGTDSHPFGPGEPLMLGGVRIDGAPRLEGHSDGDVALHAVADALLGAAGLGDLGRLFPADARTPAGIDSRILLKTVAEKVRGAGWAPANIDLTIVAARPRLAPLLSAMGQEIAAALGVDASAVNVKASTGNLSGSEGAGRSISASAIAWLAPAHVVATPAGGVASAARKEEI
jgi:2-C-methyl-D-erythritol 2,4-cyclodiphosphate synthase